MRNATETLRSGARVAYVGSGETHGTSEPKKIVVVEGTPTDEELVARFGGTFGGHVDRTSKKFGGTYDLIVWAQSE